MEQGEVFINIKCKNHLNFWKVRRVRCYSQPLQFTNNKHRRKTRGNYS